MRRQAAALRSAAPPPPPPPTGLGLVQAFDEGDVPYFYAKDTSRTLAAKSELLDTSPTQGGCVMGPQTRQLALRSGGRLSGQITTWASARALLVSNKRKGATPRTGRRVDI